MGKVAFDLEHDAFDVRHHVAVRKPKNPITVFGKPKIPLLVIGLAHIVRVPIEFDYQLGFPAEEVREVRTYRHLSAKLPSANFSTR